MNIERHMVILVSQTIVPKGRNKDGHPNNFIYLLAPF